MMRTSGKALLLLLASFFLLGCDKYDAMKFLNLNAPAPSGYTHPNPEVEQWHHAALVAGWTEAEWPVVACIMQDPVHPDIGESKGDPNVYNGILNDRSYGLMQLNTKGSLFRWFQSIGLRHRNDLFDPVTNLRFARELADYNERSDWAGFDEWRPWRGSWSSHRASCFGMEGAG